jgi:molybdopterin-guanine dinucleotide biosynthesis protein A
MDGRNKGLIPLNGKSLVMHVINRLDPRVSDIAISANQDIAAYQKFGYPIIEDLFPGQVGPLCGIYSAMRFFTKQWVLTVPCDVPLLPPDYVQRMIDHDESAKAYVAFDGIRRHNSCCLLHRSLLNDLQKELELQHLAIYSFLETHRAKQIDFSDEAPGFTNINTLQQLAELEK